MHGCWPGTHIGSFVDLHLKELATDWKDYEDHGDDDFSSFRIYWKSPGGIGSCHHLGQPVKRGVGDKAYR